MRELLNGMNVLDFTTNVAGPVAVATLADYGANVIKVERPNGGDDNRNFPPMLDGQGFIHFWCNRGKKSITLDLENAENIEIVKKLIQSADVIAESYRPGIMQKFGLSYENVVKIKPNIIYCSVSAYGLVGPYSKRPGYDLIAQAMSGQMDLNGEPDGPPMKSGMTLGDYWAGINAFGAIVTAWYHFKRTGQGQLIDASLLQNLIYNNNAILDYNTGMYTSRKGNDHPDYAPYGVFHGKDNQYAVIAITKDGEWRALAELADIPTALAALDNAGRIAVRAQLKSTLEAWISGFTDINKPLSLMEKAGIPCCKVKDMHEVTSDPHVIKNEWITTVPLPEDIVTMRSWKTRGLNATFSKNPGSPKPSPALGNYVDKVFTDLGMTLDEIEHIRKSWKKK